MRWMLLALLPVAACHDGPPVAPGGGTTTATKVVLDELSRRVYATGTTFPLAALTVPDSTTAGIVWSSGDTAIVAVSGASATARKPGVATLTATGTSGISSVAVMIVDPFVVTPLVKTSSFYVRGRTVAGINSLGWVVGSAQEAVGYTPFLARGNVISSLPCVPTDINDAGTILCAKADTIVTLDTLLAASAPVVHAGYSTIALNDSGDVLMRCTGPGYCSTYLVRRPSGTFATKSFSENVGIVGNDAGAFNVFRDVGFGLGTGYYQPVVWNGETSAATSLVRYGRYALVAAMNNKRDAVGWGEAPTGRNQIRPILWRWTGAGWASQPIAFKVITVDPYVVGVLAEAMSLNDAREVVGDFGSRAFIWMDTVRGNIVPLDSLLTDAQHQVLHAERIINGRIIVGIARNKSTSEHWVVRIAPATP